ncbi:mRNA-degrading endonuclease RelE of RelBE toxin-antitoxin system [Dyadobacter arcticus]|uniref:mRNA-degrading endonuclease RelE of RelBE toxin-antitoxin system n=1 Tax=Dyadobacter arcticus TaxID=1078754 RepID=A0ABX0UKB8_9BACT|nr:mRNA-degrading endonuclease RelE of RelBE toxin-antitoxin system [Dyadobacter arcticus]
MNFNVSASENFAKEFKRLAKKYPSLPQEVKKLADTLIQDPSQGIPIGRDCYKIRLAIKSKGRGKSGGTRIISCVNFLKESSSTSFDIRQIG